MHYGLGVEKKSVNFSIAFGGLGVPIGFGVYFSKEPKDLTVPEAATLIGLCKNPSYYNPVRNPERSRERRNVVLGQMLKYGYLSQAEFDKYSAEPMKLKFHVSDHKDGIAVYLREYLRQYLTARKPDRALYPSWNMIKFYNDSMC